MDGGLPSSHMGTVGAESVMQSFPGHQYRSHTQSGGTLGRRQEVLGLAIAAIADMPIVLRPHGVARRCVSTHAVVDVISVVSAEQVERLPSQEFEHCAPSKSSTLMQDSAGEQHEKHRTRTRTDKKQCNKTSRKQYTNSSEQARVASHRASSPPAQKAQQRTAPSAQDAARHRATPTTQPGVSAAQRHDSLQDNLRKMPAAKEPIRTQLRLLSEPTRPHLSVTLRWCLEIGALCVSFFCGHLFAFPPFGVWPSTVFAKRLGWSDVDDVIDVAEMYPAPSSDARWLPGLSEGIIGRWLAKDPSRREKVFLATNVNGFSSSAGCMQPNEIVAGNRKVTLGIAAELNENAKPAGCPARLDRDSIHEAAEASLKRLQTDVTDLYQLHWPDRYRPSIGALCCGPWKERESVPSEETVAAIKELIDSGRIRIWGSSNETTFGVSECQSC